MEKLHESSVFVEGLSKARAANFYLRGMRRAQSLRDSADSEGRRAEANQHDVLARWMEGLYPQRQQEAVQLLHAALAEAGVQCHIPEIAETNQDQNLAVAA